MMVIDLAIFEAFVFDLDGVITRTAAVHARAWKRRFDQFSNQFDPEPSPRLSTPTV
jgi:beta-phosphoglucomutase-like phosphatase (HAD superfamily)